jgi:hypothetical protein
MKAAKVTTNNKIKLEACVKEKKIFDCVNYTKKTIIKLYETA